MAGASLAMVSLVEFVWLATTSSSEEVSEHVLTSEDAADNPMPVDLLAPLIRMLTFVSCYSVRNLWIFCANHNICLLIRLCQNAQHTVE